MAADAMRHKEPRHQLFTYFSRNIPASAQIVDFQSVRKYSIFIFVYMRLWLVELSVHPSLLVGTLDQSLGNVSSW